MDINDLHMEIQKKSPTDKIIALAGNPNVGKSTIFNGLTGMKQHTGNWPGKTVVQTQGYCSTAKHSYVFIDLPGTYSLKAHSAEEEVARNFICFGNPDAVVVVCDATCLERNLNLALQTLEMTANVIICVNLMDEARRKQIYLDLEKISKRLGVPVIGTTANKKDSLNSLTNVLDDTLPSSTKPSENKPTILSPKAAALTIPYPAPIEKAIALLEPVLQTYTQNHFNSRWLCVRFLESDSDLLDEISTYLNLDFSRNEELSCALANARTVLADADIEKDQLTDQIASSLVNEAHRICSDTVRYPNKHYNSFDRKMDHILTSRLWGYPIMLGLLALIFWLTMIGANYPSELIADALFWLQDRLTDFFFYLHAPKWLHDILILGVYRVVAWVISVMLPPMTIFFPLFTLLEDSGYLPRIAYNLDKPFYCCHACGKQALTMCMGFGCNAVGIVGCRIIDSPRERLLAILTNNFVPCNGRFPTLITILSMFFIVTKNSILSSLLAAMLLTFVIIFGILITFATTKLLSLTLLKGYPSSFTLELPSYRKPQIRKVVIRSIFDRTLFVLGRALVIAAPAGLVLWLMANISVGNLSLLNHCALFLDPFAKLMGLDGVILIAFILGSPANEIVVPIILMAYMAQGSLFELENLTEMKTLFLNHNWTWTTALCTMLFSLLHWPCATTLLTIKKETGSLRWTLLAAILPTLIGITVCMLVACIGRQFA